MEKLNEIIKQYANKENSINIESIVESFWLKIIKYDLWIVDWILFEEHIWINASLDSFKQRFVIAHEFCHFLLWEKWFSKWIYHSKDPKEKRADNFATELLLPKKNFIDKYLEFWNIPTLSQYFWVPEKVVEKRLIDLLYNEKIYVRS